jgi:tetratricopeptide (TPR) repeat protein
MSFRPPISPVRRNPAAQALERAAQLRKQSRFDEAVVAMRLAARLEPENAVVWHDLGLDCLRARLRDEATLALRRAVQIKPTYALAFWRLGAALLQCGDGMAAMEALRNAVSLQPGLPEAQFQLAKLLEEFGYYEEAGVHYRKASSAGAAPRLRRLAEARALLIEGRPEEAERKLRRAVDIEPDDARSLGLLGRVLLETGRFAEAESCLERAIAIRRDGSEELYYGLLQCRKLTENDEPLIERLRSVIAGYKGSEDTLSKLYLALGKGLDDLGRYGEAMKAFDVSAELRAPPSLTDPAVFERRVDALIERFSSDFLDEKRSIGNPDPTPVFIVGMPRSWTTLCEQIVSSHPAVQGGDELTFWVRRGTQMEASEMKVDDAFFVDAASDCLNDLRKLGKGAARVTDKNPINFQWLGLIHIALPRAVFIHTRRSPIASALSIHQTLMQMNLAMPLGGSGLVRYFRAYERLMEHWRRVLPPHHLLEVHYEDLTADPVPQIKRLIAHVDLEWDDRCLEPERNDRRVKTPSRWQVRQPIYRSSVERWRSYEPYLGPLAELAPR